MKAVLAHRVVETREVSTNNGLCYIAELELVGGTKSSFWLSVKQGEKLARCATLLENGYSTKRSELHVVLDDLGRFVWCGIHSPRRSDLGFIEARFAVECDSPYVGRLDASPREAVDYLKDD